MIFTLGLAVESASLSHLDSAAAAYDEATSSQELSADARQALLRVAEEHLAIAMPGPDRDLQLAAVRYRQDRGSEARELLANAATLQYQDPRWDVVAVEVLFFTDARAQVRRSLQALMNRSATRYLSGVRPTEAERSAATVMMACLATYRDRPCTGSVDVTRPMAAQLSVLPRRWLTQTNGLALLGLLLSLSALVLVYRGAQKPTVSS